MQRVALGLTALCLAAAPVLAQGEDSSNTDTANGEGAVAGGSVPMSRLIDQGYEIKAAVPSGTDKLIIFLQNEKSAYACEFTSLVDTRCGSIN
jgi:hypothetical protein